MTVEVFDRHSLHKWKDCFNRLPEAARDVFNSPEYLINAEACGFGKSQCLTLVVDNSLYYLPFLIVAIDDPSFIDFKDYQDMQGVYGYNGIAALNPTVECDKVFNALLEEFAMENNVITAFFRCNPVLNNHLYFDPEFVYPQQKNIILDLKQPDIFNLSYEYSTRKNIRKAEREGIYVRYFKGNELPGEGLADFIRIYYSTMERNAASSFYYFDRNYLEFFCKTFYENAVFFFAYKDDTPVSAELILLNTYVGYSYLGGTLQEYYPFRPNDILKHHIIDFLSGTGRNYYCLGGGPEGVFRFKKTFAKDGVKDFYIFKKIFLPEAYEKINKKWESLYPEKIQKYGSYFQKYRF